MRLLHLAVLLRLAVPGWSAILLGVVFMSCAGLIFVTASRLIARLFSPDPRVVRVGAMLLLVAAAFLLLDGLQTVATGALRGTGDTRTPMLANLIAIGLSVFPWGMYCASGWDGERWESGSVCVWG